jgi:hypothetical protein
MAFRHRDQHSLSMRDPGNSGRWSPDAQDRYLTRWISSRSRPQAFGDVRSCGVHEESISCGGFVLGCDFIRNERHDRAPAVGNDLSHI